MEFKTFLVEGPRDTVVFSHGRMNPVTIGHQKMVEAGQKLAKHLNADYELSITHSHDPKKNPLSVDQKLKHVKRAFPKVKVTATSKEMPSFLHQAKRLHQAGYQHLVMVAGSDRVQEYHDTLHKYNGHPDFYNFKSIRVPDAKEMHKLAGVSLERDPDSEGAEGMSASKMRTHAAANDYPEFRKGVPAHFSDAQARELYNDVRQGQVRAEQYTERQRYLNGEIYNIGDRVLAENRTGEIVFRGSTYVTLQLEDSTTEKYWIADLQEVGGVISTGKLKQNPSHPSGRTQKNYQTSRIGRQSFAEKFDLKKLEPYVSRTLERKQLQEQRLPFILMNKQQRALVSEAKNQVSYNGYTTSNLDLCPGAVKTIDALISRTDLNTKFVLQAIQATDAMLGVERLARQRGFADETMTHDFTMYLSIAHDTFNLLGIPDADIGWLTDHLKIMAAYGMRPEENFGKEFGTMAPSQDRPEEVEEAVNPKTHTVQTITVHQANGKSVKRHNLVKKLDFKDEENAMQEQNVKAMHAFKHMDAPAENPQRDVNFNNSKDVFHGLDSEYADQTDGLKKAGLVSFKSFMHEPEFVKTAAQHDAERTSVHAAQVTDFAQHGVSYKSMVKAHKLEP
jgi:nicotinic acid mononucleotide adenylyltransferase